MPSLITSIHDASVLIETCRHFQVPTPEQGSIQLGPLAATGWIVRLRAVSFPIVCDAMTGLVAYHASDNAFLPFRNIMRFVHRYYALRQRLQATSLGRRSRLINVAG